MDGRALHFKVSKPLHVQTKQTQRSASENIQQTVEHSVVRGLHNLQAVLQALQQEPLPS